jgi:hypothetical protein
MKTLMVLLTSLCLTSISGVASAVEPADSTEPDHGSAAYSAVRGQELLLNGFRAPSMGLEYRRGMLSVHAGAYPTIINERESVADGTTWFAKAGVSVWFLPIRMMGNERSSFYAGASYVKNIDSENWGHGGQLEAGFRWVIYRGAFLRLGASALYAPGRHCPVGDCATVKVRPNPGIGFALPIE